MPRIKEMDKKLLVFHYSLWKKFISFFLLSSIFVFPIIICFSESIWLGISVVLIFFLMIDFLSKKLFCKIAIKEGALIFNAGGVLWKWLDRKKEFPWNQFNYVIDYGVYKNMVYYSKLAITNKKSRSQLSLKGRDIPHFNKLVEALKYYNPNVKLINIEEKFRSILRK